MLRREGGLVACWCFMCYAYGTTAHHKEQMMGRHAHRYTTKAIMTDAPARTWAELATMEKEDPNLPDEIRYMLLVQDPVDCKGDPDEEHYAGPGYECQAETAATGYDGERYCHEHGAALGDYAIWDEDVPRDFPEHVGLVPWLTFEVTK